MPISLWVFFCEQNDFVKQFNPKSLDDTLADFLEIHLFPFWTSRTVTTFHLLQSMQILQPHTPLSCVFDFLQEWKTNWYDNSHNLLSVEIDSHMVSFDFLLGWKINCWQVSQFAELSVEIGSHMASFPKMMNMSQTHCLDYYQPAFSLLSSYTIWNAQHDAVWDWEGCPYIKW